MRLAFGKLRIHRAIALATAHQVVPTRRGHVRATHPFGDLRVVDQHLYRTLNLAHPQQHFHPRQVAVIASENHRRLIPGRAISQRNHIVVARLVLAHRRNMRALLTVTAHQDARGYKSIAPETPLREHSALFTVGTCIVAGNILLTAAIQISRSAGQTRRITTPVKGRVPAFLSTGQREFTLRRIGGKRPGATLLNPNFGQQDPLIVQPRSKAQPTLRLRDLFRWIRNALEHHSDIRCRFTRHEIEEHEAHSQLSALESNAPLNLRKVGVRVRHPQRQLVAAI